MHNPSETQHTTHQPFPWQAPQKPSSSPPPLPITTLNSLPTCQNHRTHTMPPLLPASPRILISGIGIAGASFACNILRAYPSARITMLERAPALRLTGASVDIRSNAVDIIEWMGVKEAILGCTTKVSFVLFSSVRDLAFALCVALCVSFVQCSTRELVLRRLTSLRQTRKKASNSCTPPAPPPPHSSRADAATCKQ